MLFRVDCANPCREKAQLTGVCTEGFQRAIADFVRFHCPFVASAEAKSPAFGKDQLWSEVKQSGRAHLARHSIGVGKSSLGALLRKRKVTGRDASLPAPFVVFSLWNSHPWSSWGVAPNPTRDRREGTKSPLDPARGNFPLDPFSRLSWSRFHTSSACGFFILPPPMLLMFAASPANPHSPSQSAHLGRAASSLPPPAIHTASAPRRRAGQCWSRSFHPADALR